MKLLFIRHGIAMDPLEWSKGDESELQRPLTKEGLEKFRQASLGIKRIVPQVDRILSSEYTRAIQTAEILGSCYSNIDLEITGLLNVEADSNSSIGLLEKFGQDEVIALVGHEPSVSALILKLLGSSQYIRFKKGGVCLIEYSNGMIELRWMLTQKHLRLISK